MGKFSKKANLQPIDPDKTKMEPIDPDKELYAIELLLDSIPDDIWKNCLERKYDESQYPQKRPVIVVDKRLRIQIISSNFKNMLQWVRRLIHKTNHCVEKHNEKIRKGAEENRKRKKKIEEAMKKMRKDLEEI